MPAAKRELYDLQTTQASMAEVNAALDAAIDVYLLGGCAMSYLKLKTSTKDLDLVLRSEDDLAVLERALAKCHYASQRLDKPYDQLRANGLYKKPGAPQWDLYVRRVCGFLELSPGMISRSQRLETQLTNLRLHACAPEDIFVFKSITERQADLDDMDLLAGRGLDWTAVGAEMEWQRQHSDTVWSVKFLERLEALADRPGFVIPILPRIRLMAEEDMEAHYGHKLPK